MTSRRDHPLNWQLTVLSLGLVLPTLLFVGVLLWRLGLAERGRVEDEAKDLSLGIAVGLDREINGVLAALQALATSPSLQNGDMAAFYDQASVVGRAQGINISMRDIDGHTMLTTRAPLGAPVEVPLALAEADREVLRTNKALVTNVFTGAVSAKPAFQIITAPIAVAGTPAYVLGASIDVEYLGNTIRREHLPSGWIGVVIDRKGVFVSRSEHQEAYAGKMSAGLSTQISKDTGIYYGRNRDGQELLAGFAKSALTGWTASASLPRTAVDAPLRRSLLTLIGLGLGLALLATSAALITGRKIGGAFDRLRAAAVAIGQGHEVLPVQTRVSEVNEVGLSLSAASQQLMKRARERDDAEAALREREELLRALNETLEARVVERTRERNRWWDATIDLVGSASFDGYLKAVNPAWTSVLGWTEQELLSRPFVEFAGLAGQASLDSAIEKLRNGENLYGYVEQITTKAGGQRTVIWTAVPVPDDEMFYLVGRDITDQRQIEEALRQSQKMEAVGQLTGGLAHDFNNLLTGIGGSLELLQNRIAQGRTGELDRFIDAAQGAARRAAALTHRLLAFSRRQTLDPKPTDVNRLISGLEELLRRTVGPAVSIEVVTAAGLWPTLVDPNQLENALLNLCINSRDAMPDGGSLTIETGNRWMDQRGATARDLSPGQYVSMCVSDTGTGMAPDVVAKAFEPFFTTKPMGQGTGLGLSMIYGFVRQSGGQVRIYSEVGQGTMVCIYLPRYLGEEATLEEVSVTALVPSAMAGQTVLIVDDEPTVRMMVTEILAELGHSSLEAADGPSGLKILQSGARIDLLVTDVGLPGGLNGRQMADAARVARPELKVLFITGYAENAVVRNGHLEAGMRVVTKPFTMVALGNVIKDLLSASNG